MKDKPLSPALSPLVPRGERETTRAGSSVVSATGAREPLDNPCPQRPPSWPCPFGRPVDVVIVLFRPVCGHIGHGPSDGTELFHQRLAVGLRFERLDSNSRSVGPGGFGWQLDHAAFNCSGVTHGWKISPRLPERTSLAMRPVQQRNALARQGGVEKGEGKVSDLLQRRMTNDEGRSFKLPPEKHRAQAGCRVFGKL
jgi:hypothetical protein